MNLQSFQTLITYFGIFTEVVGSYLKLLYEKVHNLLEHSSVLYIRRGNNFKKM